MSIVNPAEVVLVNNERVTVRIGDVFLKLDADQTRTDREVDAMALAPVPTPQVLWRKAPALALARVPGSTLARLGEPSTASPQAWQAAGATIRALHDAPLPPWTGKTLDQQAVRLAEACDWLVANDVLPVEVINRNRALAETALQPWKPVFIHGDLHLEHLFVDGDEVTGIIDWSEACQGNALLDLSSLTLGHAEHVDDVVRGYGGDVDRDLVLAWHSFRCLVVVPWLFENNYGAPDDFPETAILRSRARDA